MNLVGGMDQEVAAWASQQVGIKFVQPLSAFGIVHEGSIRGAAIFNDFYPGGNIELTYIGPGTISRRVLRGLIRYAFDQCGAGRVTAKTRKHNTVARRLLPKAGFTLEGTAKRYYGTAKGDDALIFVLYRDKAMRWLGNN